MSQLVKKFAFALAILVVSTSAIKAEELLDAASSAAKADLAEVMEASPGARRALGEAKGRQQTANEELSRATSADKAKAEVLKKAKEDYNFVVGVEDTAYRSTGTTALLPSINVKTQAELEAAALAVKNAQLITATHPKDTVLTEALAKAQRNWDRVSPKVGEIRNRIKVENGPYFNQPSIMMEDERMDKLLTKIYAAAKAEKAKTEKALKVAAKAKAEADAAVKAAIDALKELKAERDRIRATEELRNGFIEIRGIRGKVDQLKTAVDQSGEKIVTAVNESGKTIVTAVNAVGTKVDTVNDTLVRVEGNIVCLSDALQESMDAISAKVDTKSAELLAAIGKVPVETKASNDKLIAKLDLYTEQLKTAPDGSEEQANIHQKLKDLHALVLSHVTADARRMVRFDRCLNTWVALEAVPPQS